MIDVVKSIILDFHENQLETGVPHLETEAVPGKATVCMGVGMRSTS
jgi:hypothetical protein